MLALAHKPEAEALVSKLKSLYARLLELSTRQLDGVNEHASAEHFQELFQQMTDEWESIQKKIIATQASLKDIVSSDMLRDILSVHIAPLASKAQSNMEQAVATLGENLRSTASMIRSANEHKQASKAYSGSGYDDHTAIYFDEKK